MLAIHRLFFVVACLHLVDLSAQVSGCTDPMSTNFNPLAEINDGSCMYANQSLTPFSAVMLSDTLQETSGLIHWNGRIWTQNDNADTNLYAINTSSGAIEMIKPLPGVLNTDWEEISQDENYIYIGDFGNNSSGNRSNLHILRILKSSVNANPEIDTIAFSYSNQTNFSAVQPNTANFDCEAFIVSADSIYLFTKRWGDKKTFLYALEKMPGSHIAMLRDSLDVQGLITGAHYMEDRKLITLCGYTSALQPFIYTLYDFPDRRFFSGNKRRFGISLTYTQIEGISTEDGFRYYLSNEKLGSLNIPPKLHVIDLTDYFYPYFTADLFEMDHEMLKLYPNPAKDLLHVDLSPALVGKSFAITDLSGKTVCIGKFTGTAMTIPVFEKGMYTIQVDHAVVRKFFVE